MSSDDLDPKKIKTNASRRFCKCSSFSCDFIVQSAVPFITLPWTLFVFCHFVNYETSFLASCTLCCYQCSLFWHYLFWIAGPRSGLFLSVLEIVCTDLDFCGTNLFWLAHSSCDERREGKAKERSQGSQRKREEGQEGKEREGEERQSQQEVRWDSSVCANLCHCQCAGPFIVWVCCTALLLLLSLAFWTFTVAKNTQMMQSKLQRRWRRLKRRLKRRPTKSLRHLTLKMRLSVQVRHCLFFGL